MATADQPPAVAFFVVPDTLFPNSIVLWGDIVGHPWEDKWVIQRRVGKGGQGVAQLVNAKDAPGVLGVLKTLIDNKSKVARVRMRREVANLQTLEAAGARVPKVLAHNTDQFEERCELFLVMEYIPGSTLAEFIEKSDLGDITTARQITCALADNVRIAHSFSILHRDLKPDNIIVRNGVVSDIVVLDYGLSFNITDDDLTETGETFRNKFLDLPETVAPGGNKRDPRSDVTAVAAVFFYCLTREKPGHLVDGNGKQPHRRIHSCFPGFGNSYWFGAVDSIFTQAFPYSIANRYQTIDSFYNDMKDIPMSAGTDPSDPAELAKKLSDDIRRRDRVTQIREFQVNADKLLSQIHQLVGEFHGRLGSFQLSAMGVSMEPKLPAGLELVRNSSFLMALQLTHHKFIIGRSYVVSARGQTLVLLAYSHFFKDGGSITTPERPNFETVVEYETSPSDEEMQLVRNDFQSWLNRSLKELASKV